MNKVKMLWAFSVSFLCLAAISWSREIAPIVSTEWLLQNLSAPGLVVVDIRNPEQFKKGHIAGSVNVPLADWATKAGDLNMELPSDRALANLLGKLGIADGTSHSIVIVNRTETDFARADMTRVAWTCMIAGLKNVAVLDGGYTKWARENKPKSTDAAAVREVTYKGSFDKSLMASKSYVQSRLGKSIIADTRIPEDYFGITFKSGHIKGAVDLPTPWAFSADGTFKAEADLRAMATGVLGKDSSKEVLVYCEVGGYASTWWFLLTRVLGYKNAKLYDGSIEEWLQDPPGPVSTYCWR